MKPSYIQKRVGLVVLCLLSPITSYAANDAGLSDGLTYYCANTDVEYQESVRIGAGTRVSLLDDTSVLQTQTQSELSAEKYLIKSELLKIGIRDECAEFLLAQGQSNGVNARVYFNFDASALSHESSYVLDSLLKQIQGASANLLLNGYTDSIGSKEYNFSLGMRRAQAVKAYLVSKQVAASSIKTHSHGESKPAASNATPEGRQHNRRVEIIQE